MAHRAIANHRCQPRTAPRKNGTYSFVAHHEEAYPGHGGVKVHAVLTHSDDPAVASVRLDLVRKLMQENDLHARQPRASKVTRAPGPGAGGRRPGERLTPAQARGEERAQQ